MSEKHRQKLLIIGHARHGKDTVAEFLRELYGYSFQSSSQAAADIFIYDVLKHKYGYDTPEECFTDRVNHRKEWHDLICEYNSPDKSRLAKGIMTHNDIYVGMRSNEELQACLAENVFDLVIGVFSSNKPLESKDSFNINLWRSSHVILPNSGTLADLRERVVKLQPLLFV